MAAEGGATQEWRSASLPRYARMTRQVEALIAGPGSCSGSASRCRLAHSVATRIPSLNPASRSFRQSRAPLRQPSAQR